VRDIPADIAWFAYACAQCGACVDECPQFYGRGWESQSPRGKWFWLREHMEGRAEWDQRMVDTFLACTTCEKCVVRCPSNLPIEPSWLKLRGKLIDKQERMTFPAFEMMAAALSGEGNIWAAYRKDRDAWFPEDLKEKHGPDHTSKAVYFAGCTASYVETSRSARCGCSTPPRWTSPTWGRRRAAAPRRCWWLGAGTCSPRR
jgi:Fe-S oxidoreductase